MKKIVLVAMFSVSCGQLAEDMSLVDCNKDSSNKNCQKEEIKTMVSINGAVSGAFDVTVDGETYSDIESYYTVESDNLNERVAKAGYEGYDAVLDAKLGFKDLTQGMKVYLAPAGSTGIATNTSVGYDDTFSFRLPSSTEDGRYMLKAVKRIAVVLTKGDEIKRFCFNFSAVRDVEIVEGKADPIVMNSFETSITKYDCDSDNGGLDIPQADKIEQTQEVAPVETPVETPVAG